VVVLRLSRDPGTGEVRSTACEVARVDHDVLVLRAGPDAPTLRGKSVVVFGVGAIGSHLGVLLARSGVGKLTLVDGQRLRPGDIVRHAAPDETVGVPKAYATQLTLRQYAPWTTTTFVAEAPWGPGKIRELCEGADLIVDATGSITFSDLLDRSLVDTEVPLLSVALYRGGDVARVRLVPRNGVRLHERAEPQYRLIPTGPVEPAPVWETGCAAPVNNAPPASVASAAALAGRWAIELLAERTTESIDIVEVYQPIEEPFDRIGTQRFGG
jgi:molybdopterin/thiamine biosynthesis adenylyltransferase